MHNVTIPPPTPPSAGGTAQAFRRRFRWRAASATLVLAAVACTEPTPVDPAPEIASPATSTAASGPSNEFAGVERNAPALTVTGSFRPGAPLTVSSEIRANRASRNTSYALFALDEEDEARPGSPRAPRELGRFQGDLAQGASERLGGTLRFAKPGYYRVVAIASGGPVSQAERDRERGGVIDLTERVLSIVIDPAGGRLTTGFDSAVAINRSPMFGSYGPFVPTTTGPRPQQTPGSVGSNGAAMSGRVWYRSRDPNADPLVLVPVKDALVDGVCYDYNDRPTTVRRTVRTDASGFFTFQCGAFHAGARVNWYFSNGYADVKGGLGAVAGGYIQLANGAYRDLISASDHAARVYLRLSQYVPLGNARFGTARGVMPVWASSTTIPRPGYLPTADRIEYSGDRTFGPDGDFVILHEYGHAFHEKAIRTHSHVCPATHPPQMATTFTCAFVEAFADVYAAWTANGLIPPSAFYSPATLENNGFQTGGDGAIIQGAVGGFLLDLLDDATDPDGVPGDDDGVTYPGSYVAKLIETCQMSSPSQPFTETVDRFVYCAERDLTAGSGSPYHNWTTYGGFVEQAVEPVSSVPRYNWSAASIRRLWRYNLFNLGSLP